MRKIITGKNEKGEEVIIGELSSKFGSCSKMNRPVFTLLKLEQDDYFFFKYEPKVKDWLMLKELTFLNLESELLDIYQNQIDISGDVCLMDFVEQLYLKFFRFQ